MSREWLQDFKLGKLCSTALVALGVTSLGAWLAPPAAAGVCANPYDLQGGSSLSDPTVIPSGCNFPEIQTDQLSLPGYWEFTSSATQDLLEISADVTDGICGYGCYGTFDGTLSLYTGGASPTLVDSQAFEGNYGFAPTNTASFTASVAPSTSYIFGITSVSADPTLTVTVAPASAVPEPGTLTILGGAIAGLGVLRRRRKKPA